MTRIGKFALAAVVTCGIGAVPAATAASGQYTKNENQKKAATHDMTGCLQKGDEANTYKLTNAEGKGPKTAEIVETASGVDLAAHVGHKVTITGTTVSARAAEKTEGTTGTASKKEERGEHHMRVTGVKMVSTTCP